MIILPKPDKDLDSWAGKLIVALEEEFAKAPTIVEAGTVILFASDIDLVGYLLCDGDEYLIEDFPVLARRLEDQWGAATAGYFRVPDLGTAGIDGDGLQILIKT